MKTKTLLLVALLLISFIVGAQNTSQSVPNKLRVKLTKPLADKVSIQLSNSGVSTGVMTTGDASFDHVCIDFGATGLSRVFPFAGKFEEKHKKYGLDQWYEMTVDHGTDDAILSFKDLNSVVTAEHVYRYSSDYLRTSSPNHILNINDPRVSEQWHYNNSGSTGGTVDADISLFEAWNIETGSSDVVVSVHDSGFDTDHPDLQNVLWVNEGEIANNGIDDDNNGFVDDIHGFNFAGLNGDVEDYNGHGTHVSGTIAANNGNGLGVSGIAGGTAVENGVRIMMMRLGDDSGSPFIYNPAPSFVYAADMGAVISSNSWGGGGYDQSVVDAINYYTSEANQGSGGLVVISAGNSDSSFPDYRSHLENVMMVAATNHNDEKSFYSNYGEWIDISAPGGETFIRNQGVLSTINGGGYDFFQGTSMACPHVTGAAALLMSLNPSFQPAEVFQAIVNSADSIDHLNSSFFEGKLGAGRLNAEQALLASSGIVGVGDLSIVPNKIQSTLDYREEGEYSFKLVNIGESSSTYSISIEEEYASNLTMTPESGILLPGESNNLTLSVTSTGLADGTEINTSITVFYNNGDSFSLPVDIYLSGDPLVLWSPTSIAFPETYLTVSDSVEVTINNFGTDTLVMSFDPDNDRERFSSSFPDTIKVSPQGELLGKVFYNASESGTYATTWSYTTNGVNQNVVTVNLQGSTLDSLPPTLSINKESIDIVNTFGGFGRESFLITNDGDVDLTYAIEIEDSLDLVIAAVGDDGLDDGYRWKDSDEPNGPNFEWLDISSTGDEHSLGSYNYSFNYYFDDFVFPFYGQDKTSFEVSRFGYITFGYNGHSSFPGNIPNRFGPDDVIAPLWKNYSYDSNVRIYVQEYDDRVIVQYDDVEGDQYQVVLYENGDIIFHYNELVSTGESASIGIEDYQGNYGAQVSYFQPYLKNNFSIQFSDRPVSFNLNPKQDTLAAGESRFVNVNYDISFAPPGFDERYNLKITSNDILNPEVYLPVNVSVTGVPEIGASLDNSSIVNFFNQPTFSQLKIFNTGIADLEVSQIAFENNHFDVSGIEFPIVLAKDSSVTLNIPFLPTEIGDYPEILRVISNDPIDPTIEIPFTVELIGLPSITTAPDSIEVSLKYGEVHNGSILISNADGESTLEYQLSSFVGVESDSVNTTSLKGLRVGFFDNDYNYSQVIDILRNSGVDDITEINDYSYDLSDYDLLFFNDLIRYANYSFLSDVKSWVSNGGKVIISADNDRADDEINHLLSGTGIGTYHSYYYFYPNSITTKDHPILSGVDNLNFGSMELFQFVTESETTEALIYAHDDNQTKVVSSVTNYGQGAILVNTAEFFSDSYMYSQSYDNTLFASNAIHWIANLGPVTFSSTNGVLDAGEQVWIPYTLNSLNNFDSAGISYAGIKVEHNIPEQSAEIIPIIVDIEAAPSLSIKVDTVNFAEQYVGLTASQRIEIRNNGLDTLRISAFESAHGDFEINGDSILAPDAYGQFIIEYTPSSLDSITTTLSIASNDPVNPLTTVVLNGSGENSVIVLSSPSTILDTIGIGESHSIPLVLKNLGSDDTEVILSLEQYNSSLLVDDFSNESGEDSIVNDPRIKPDIAILSDDSNWKNEAVREMLIESGQFNSVTLLRAGNSQLSYEDLVIFDAILFYRGRYDRLYNGVELGNNLARYVDNGGGVVVAMFEMADGTDFVRLQGDWSQNGYQLMKCYGTRFVGSNDFGLNHVYQSDHPILKGVSSFFTNDFYYRSMDYFSIELQDDVDVIASIYPQESAPLIVTKEIGDGKRVDLGLPPYSSEVESYSWDKQSDVGLAIANSLSWVSRPVSDATDNVDWLTINSQKDTLAAGDSITFDLTVNASGFFERSYRANIKLRSNDSREPEQYIPVFVQSKGQSNVVIQEQLSFDPTTIGFTSLQPLRIINEGNGQAVIDSLVFSDSTFSAQFANASLTIDPGSSIDVEIQYSPDMTQAHDGFLNVYHDGGNMNVVELSGTAVSPGQIEVSTDSIFFELTLDEVKKASFDISNIGLGDLKYNLSGLSNRSSLSALDEGLDLDENYPTISKGEEDIRVGKAALNGSGADRYGYTFVDSNEEELSIEFVWEDISSVSTNLPLGDDASEKIDLPFEFPFYGDRKTSIYVSSNGYLTFDKEFANIPVNSPIPSKAQPNGIIAPFWRDLIVNDGAIHYKADEESLVVQYDEVNNYGLTGTYTFQVILYSHGGVDFKYLTMEGESNRGTVGIESESANYGLPISFNGSYVQDSMVTQIRYPIQFVNASRTIGVLKKDEVQTIELEVNPEGLIGGEYNELLEIVSNDTANASVIIPLTVLLQGDPEIALDTNSLSYDTLSSLDKSLGSVFYQSIGTDDLIIDTIISSSQDIIALSATFSTSAVAKDSVEEMGSFNLNLFSSYAVLSGQIALGDYDEINSIALTLKESTALPLYLDFNIEVNETGRYLVLASQFLSYDDIDPSELKSGNYHIQIDFLDELTSRYDLPLVEDFASIAPNDYGRFYLFNNKTTTGPLNALLTIASNSVENPFYLLNLEGFIIEEEVALKVVSDELKFKLTSGDSAQSNLMLFNTGDFTLDYDIDITTDLSKQSVVSDQQIQVENSLNNNLAADFNGEMLALVNGGVDGNLLSVFSYQNIDDLSNDEALKVEPFDLGVKLDSNAVLAILGNEVFILNLDDGSHEVLGSMTDVYNWTSMAMNPIDTSVYLATGRSIFELHLEDLTVERLADLRSGYVSDMTFDGEGRLIVADNDLYGRVSVYDMENDRHTRLTSIPGNLSRSVKIGWNPGDDKIYLVGYHWNDIKTYLYQFNSRDGFFDKRSVFGKNFNGGFFGVRWIDFSADFEPMLSVDKKSGSIPPGGGVSIDMTVKSKGFIDGLYSGELSIVTNDPLKYETTIRAEIEIVGQSAFIKADVTSVDYGHVTVGEQELKWIEVENTGQDRLVIHDLYASDVDYVINFDMIHPSDEAVVNRLPYNLGVGERAWIPVELTPTRLGAYHEQLTIVNSADNDSLLSVSLFGQGLQGDIEAQVSVDHMSFSVPREKSFGDSLSLTNVGTKELIYTVIFNDSLTWLTYSGFEVADTLSLGEEIIIKSDFTSEDLPLGHYEDTLLISTNDLVKGTIEIPISFDVVNRKPEILGVFGDQLINGVGSATSVYTGQLIVDEDEMDSLQIELVSSSAIVNIDFSLDSLYFNGVDTGAEEIMLRISDGNDTVYSEPFMITVNGLLVQEQMDTEINLLIGERQDVDLSEVVTDSDDQIISFEISGGSDAFEVILTNDNKLLVIGKAVGEGVVNLIATDGVDMMEIEFKVSVEPLPLAAHNDKEVIDFAVYPNPASVVIRLDAERQVLAGNNYVIEDLNGRRIVSGNMGSSNVVAIEKLDAGVFFISIVDENGEVLGRQKFVKHFK